MLGNGGNDWSQVVGGAQDLGLSPREAALDLWVEEELLLAQRQRGKKEPKAEGRGLRVLGQGWGV